MGVELAYMLSASNVKDSFCNACMKPQRYRKGKTSVKLYNFSSRQRRYINTHGQCSQRSVTGPCREPNESHIDPITVFLLTSILISLTRVGVSILLLPDVPLLAAYSPRPYALRRYE